MKTLAEIAYLKGREDVISINFLLTDLVEEHIKPLTTWLDQNNASYKFDDGFEELYIPTLDIAMLADSDLYKKIINFTKNDKAARVSGKQIFFDLGIIFDLYKAKFENWLNENGIIYEECASSDPMDAWREIYVDILPNSQEYKILSTYLKNDDDSDKFKGITLDNCPLSILDFTAVIYLPNMYSENRAARFESINHVVKFLVDSDYSQGFDAALTVFESYIQSKLTQFDNRVLLVGDSLGGYFASHFSEKYEIPALLIAPTLDPSAQFEAHNSTIEPINLDEDLSDFIMLLDRNHYELDTWQDQSESASKAGITDKFPLDLNKPDQADLDNDSKKRLNDAIENTIGSFF